MTTDNDPTNMEQRTRADGKTEFSTYRRADNELIYGEFSFVVHTEFFDDIDQPIKVVKETWVLESREEIEFKPYWWEDDEPEEMDETLTGGL